MQLRNIDTGKLTGGYARILMSKNMRENKPWTGVLDNVGYKELLDGSVKATTTYELGISQDGWYVSISTDLENGKKRLYVYDGKVYEERDTE